MSAFVPAKALILDFGSVISMPLFQTHRQTEQSLGLVNGSLTWMGPFDPDNDPLWQAMQADQISERAYWLTRAKEVGALLGEEWTEMSQFVRRGRGDDPMNVMRSEMLELIKLAKTQGRKTAILSNELDLFFGADIRGKLPFIADFDVIVDATYTRILKPDPRAYQLCLDKLGLAAEECVFIDDQQRNVRGGLAIGLRALHMDVRSPQLCIDEAIRELALAL